MRFQTPLVPATLIRRYKRFLADIRLGDGQEVTVHCPNPGSMLGLAAPGSRIWVEPNDDPRKKLRYGWRLVQDESGHFTGIDTSLPNKLLRSALEQRRVPRLGDYTTVRPEQTYGQNSRFDFLLTGSGLPDAFVEVKSVTLSRRPGWAEFPDSVTSRGKKHLDELTDAVANGYRAVMLYLVQRTDCECVTLARDIDPAYARAFDAAVDRGVEVLALGTRISPQGIEIGSELAFHTDHPA